MLIFELSSLSSCLVCSLLKVDFNYRLLSSCWTFPSLDIYQRERSLPYDSSIIETFLHLILLGIGAFLLVLKALYFEGVYDTWPPRRGSIRECDHVTDLNAWDTVTFQPLTYWCALLIRSSFSQAFSVNRHFLDFINSYTIIYILMNSMVNAM